MKTKAVLIAALFAVCFGRAFAQQSAGQSLIPNEGESQQNQQEEKKRQLKELARQREYWSTWPNAIPIQNKHELLYETERKFNTVILGYEYLDGSTNTWNIGCGKSLIEADEFFVRKIDKEGRVVWYGRKVYANEVEEIRWYNDEMASLLGAKRAKWAEEHGMTVEEASHKYDEWSKQRRLLSRPLARPSPNGHRLLSLRERRAEREQARQEELAKGKELGAQRQAEAAEKEMEKERESQRQAEREEQRRALLLLKEELKAQREAMERARAERESMVEKDDD